MAGPPTSGSTGADIRTIDLSFLSDLKEPDPSDEDFLIPSTLFVRDCMRTVFGLFLEDAKKPRRKPDAKRSAALIGSPGVGKSILFFLAALYQASRGSKVVYFRKTSEGVISLFVMTPINDGSDESGRSDDDGGGGNSGASVRVWFSRKLYAQNLNEVRLSAVAVQVIDYDEYYTFVDGPRYPRGGENASDVLGKGYNYFCTSGGMPNYKNDESGKRLWVLDGWSREESVECLVQYLRALDTGGGEADLTRKAEDAYNVCGGNIRSLLSAVSSGDGLQREMDNLMSETARLSDPDVKLLLESTERGPDSRDRMRTMFTKKVKPVSDDCLPDPRLCLRVGPGTGQASWRALGFRRVRESEKGFRHQPGSLGLVL
jgi:hypothetical protein